MVVCQIDNELARSTVVKVEFSITAHVVQQWARGKPCVLKLAPYRSPVDYRLDYSECLLRTITHPFLLLTRQ